jgi:hypothetical protein
MPHCLEVYGDNCSVCMDELKSNQRAVLVLACNHAYHHDCIVRWIKRGNGCPMCRMPVFITLGLYGSVSNMHNFIKVEINGNPYEINTNLDIVKQVCRGFDKELKKVAPIHPPILSWFEPEYQLRIRDLDITIRRTESPWSSMWSSFSHGCAIGTVFIISMHTANSIRRYMWPA